MSNVIAVNSTNLDLSYFNKEAKRKELLVEEEGVEETRVVEDRRVSEEEARSLYYASKANNLMKSKIEIYMDLQDEEELSYEDIRDVKKLENRVDMLEYYRDEVRIQNRDKNFEMWA